MLDKSRYGRDKMCFLCSAKFWLFIGIYSIHANVPETFIHQYQLYMRRRFDGILHRISPHSKTNQINSILNCQMTEYLCSVVCNRFQTNCIHKWTINNKIENQKEPLVNWYNKTKKNSKRRALLKLSMVCDSIGSLDAGIFWNSIIIFQSQMESNRWYFSYPNRINFPQFLVFENYIMANWKIHSFISKCDPK